MILPLALAFCLPALLVAGTTSATSEGGATTRTAPANASSGVNTGLPAGVPSAPADGEPRPQACAEGKTLGPVRIQIGAVDALVFVGNTVTLPVLVKGVCDLGGFSFWLTYDRSVVQLLEVGETPFLAGSPPVDYDFTGLLPGAPRQTIRANRPPESGGVDGRGILARLVFRGLAQGNTRINLVRLHLYDPGGDEISSFQVPVRLTVLPVPVPPGDPRDMRGAGGRRP